MFPVKLEALAIMYRGNPVNYMAIQVKYTVSEVEHAFEGGFC